MQEITSAFTVFPHNGVRAHPHFIKRVEDYHGVTLMEHQNQFDQVISPETAGKMLYLLRSVVERGTARRAQSLERPLGGKTGTTNDSTDSWFVGFTPQITTGVWAGYDEKKSLGKRVYGATLALPIWIDFMEDISETMPIEDFEASYTPLDITLAQRHSVGVKGEEVVQKPWSVEDIPPPQPF